VREYENKTESLEKASLEALARREKTAPCEKEEETKETVEIGR